MRHAGDGRVVVRKTFYCERIDFDAHVTWIGETVLIRYRRVVVMIDMWWKDVTFWTRGEASADEISAALERVRRVLPRQDAVPTRRLPRIAEPARL